MANIIISLVLALALGSLIGLEREYARYHKRGHEYGGIRTFPLIALFGCLAAYFGERVSVWLLAIALAITGILIIVAYLAQVKKKHTGATTEVAGFLTFFIGMLTYYGEWKFAVSLAIIITILLHARSLLHHFAEKITKAELRHTLIFAFVAFVLLPFLPNEWFGPLQMFNPYVTWFMMVLVLGISFLGYAFMKWFGDQGITLAGLLGGLASSTALTMSYAERSVREFRHYRALALGVILAHAALFIRILVEIFIINRLLLVNLLFPLGILAILTSGFSWILWRKLPPHRPRKTDVQLSSPFRLLPALKFGILFAAILAIVKTADVYLSSQGVYVISVISGLADVDAIVVSLSQLAKESLPRETAAKGILLGTLMNIIFKGGLVAWFGGRSFKWLVLSWFAVLIVVGGFLLWFVL